jgi:hypothetical protein
LLCCKPNFSRNPFWDRTRGNTCSVASEAEHLVVDERVAQELRAFVVRERVLVEVVRQVESSRRQKQPVREQLGAKPHLTQIQGVLALEPRGVPVQQRQARNLGVGRRPAESDDVGEKDGVLSDAGGEEQVGGRQGVGVIVDHRIGAFGPLRELGTDRRIDADLHVVLFGIGQRLFDFFADSLAAVNALASIGDGTLRSGNLFVVFVPIASTNTSTRRTRVSLDRTVFDSRSVTRCLSSDTCCSNSCRSASAACAAEAASSVISSWTF